MRELPVFSPAHLSEILTSLGFKLAGKSVMREGKHLYFRHPDGRATVVPTHDGDDICPRLLSAVLKDIEPKPETGPTAAQSTLSSSRRGRRIGR
ncbi:MAG: type II toxin-antitoxin system HicA family toxin [Nitrospirae bacterium]|nr:type II toxin-antitoxin system HicA family toxin [Nitrospirota bacterium]